MKIVNKCSEFLSTPTPVITLKSLNKGDVYRTAQGNKRMIIDIDGKTMVLDLDSMNAKDPNLYCNTPETIYPSATIVLEGC